MNKFKSLLLLLRIKIFGFADFTPVNSSEWGIVKGIWGSKLCNSKEYAEVWRLIRTGKIKRRKTALSQNYSRTKWLGHNRKGDFFK